ncbi:MAG: AAA family ATPase [Methanobrevibacter sp.]|jgi:predicted ATPase|nr:AAA family ATPase [Candidatus Methanovirga meridionalis]
MGKLKLKIKDFGSISGAELELGKINIIAGVNGSGKTTASKILYSFLISLTHEGIDFHNKEIINYFNNILSFVRLNPEYSFFHDTEIFDIEKKVLANNFSLKDFEYVLNELKSSDLIYSSKNFKESIEKLEDNVLIKNNINKRISLIFKEIIENEFSQDIGHNNNTSATLQNGNGGFSVNFPLTESNINYKKINFPINGVFYIETPFIFDFLNVGTFKNDFGIFLFHQLSLIRYLALNEKKSKSYFEKKGNELNGNPLDIIQNIMQGKIQYDKKKEKFTYKKSNDSEYEIKNTAAGIKTIGILQGLLNNGLDTNSFIIMDEPEVHLHPSWQIKLAEAIVLLSKYENINFYINSHSPQFIEAIDVYSKRYELENETNFYITQEKKDLGKFDFIKIERNQLKILYRDLSNSYNIIDRVGAENFAKDF